MDTLTEKISSFTQEVLMRFADELPQETFEQVSEILLRELQYQQIQEKIYVPLTRFLEELRENSQTQEKIVRRMDTVLASNVQQQRRDEQQLEFLENIQSEQSRLYKLSEDAQNNLKSKWGEDLQNFNASVEKICSNIIQKISDKIENANVQYNKDSTNITNQMGMLLEINKEFIKDFGDTDFEALLEDSAKKMESIQEKSATELKGAIEKLPKKIQQEVIDLLDTKKLTDILEQQKEFIADKLNSHMDKMEISASSLEESQLLLRPIQDAVLGHDDNFNNLENILRSVRDHVIEVIELQGKQANLVSETINTSFGKGFPPEFLENIQKQIQSTVQDSLARLEEVINEGIRPKDLDTLKRGISKMLETGFWRVEQLMENAPKDKSDEIQVKDNIKGNIEQFTRAVKNSLQQTELSLQDKMDTSSQSQVKQIQQNMNTYLQSQMEVHNENITQKFNSLLKEQIESIKENFQHQLEKVILPVKEKISKVENVVLQSSNINSALDKVTEKWQDIANKMEAKLEDKLEEINDRITIQEDSYNKLQKTIQLLENKVLGLLVEKENTKSDKIAAICPHCGREAIGSSSMEGQRVMCRHCRNEFTFPKA